MIKVARTIADLAGREALASADVAEALDCRRGERERGPLGAAIAAQA